MTGIANSATAHIQGTSVSGTLSLDGALTSYESTRAGIPSVVVLANGAPPPQGSDAGGFVQVYTFQTDVTGTPVKTAVFPLPDGSFNGRVAVTGRLITPGAGGGATGDYYGQQNYAKLATQAAVTSLKSAALDGAPVSDPSLTGTVVQFSVAANTLIVSVDTTLAGTDAGGTADWEVVLDGSNAV